MTAVAIILFLLVVVLAGIVVALFAMQQDQRQRQQQEQQTLLEQNNQLTERLQSQQAQWEERFRKARERFGKVMDLDDEADRVRVEIQSLKNQYQQERDQLGIQSNKVRADYQLLQDNYRAASETYDRLRREISLLEGNVEDISFGLYKPTFTFDTSEQFRTELESLRVQKKEMVHSNQATQCMVQWSVGGSQSEGARMQKQLAKLMLRAFNGETDAAIANCRWNNITRMQERIQRAFTAINQLGTVIQVSIVPKYRDVALNELQLTFEYEEKKRAEAEEQRQIRDQMKEEERVQREAERAQAEAAAEEARYTRALAKARDEVKTATGEKLAELLSRIKELEGDLSAAQAQHQRAISMAQLTRCGYVYIISNIGSFGENCFKLGLTRRLEPMDRIRELGDASVPFSFDVHGMIYSDDAPALECALHQQFRDRSVNLINPRKEFFYVTLEEIEEFITSRGLTIRITKLAEAKEYRQSLTIRQQSNGNGHARQDAFSEALPACVEA